MKRNVKHHAGKARLWVPVVLAVGLMIGAAVYYPVHRTTDPAPTQQLQETVLPEKETVGPEETVKWEESVVISDWSAPENLADLPRGRFYIQSVQLTDLSGELPSGLEDPWRVTAKLLSKPGYSEYGLVLTGGDPRSLPDLDANFMISDQKTAVLIYGQNEFADEIIKAFLDSAKAADPAAPLTAFRYKHWQEKAVDLADLDLLQGVQKILTEFRNMKAGGLSLNTRRWPDVILLTQDQMIFVLNYSNFPERVQQLQEDPPVNALSVEANGPFAIVRTERSSH